MTVKQIAIQLLQAIGVTTLDATATVNVDNQPGLGANDLASVVTCINGALQEIFQFGNDAICVRTAEGVLRPPSAVTLSVTQYSSTIASFTTYATWMNGCTIRIPGDDADNRLVNTIAGNSTTLILSRPYLGSTASAVAATVYADCIVLPATLAGVIEPVDLPGVRCALPGRSLDEFLRGSLYPHTETGEVNSTSAVLTNKTECDPYEYCVTNEYISGDTSQQWHLRFNPMPGRAIPVRYRARQKPPVVTSADIDSGDHTTDPNTILPVELMESVLLPICLQRWTAHPNFSALTSRDEIARQYTAARNLMRSQRPVTANQRAVYLDRR